MSRGYYQQSELLQVGSEGHFILLLSIVTDRKDGNGCNLQNKLAIFFF